MTDPKPNMNTGVPIQNAKQYHWWYDAKTAGVRNSPPSGMGTSPTGSPPGFSFMSSSPASTSGINPSANNQRRDSLKNMVHLAGDFATQ